MRGNGHFNKEIRTHPTTWCNVQSSIFLDTIWAKFYLLLCPHGANVRIFFLGYFFSSCTWIFSQCIFWHKPHDAHHVIRSCYPRRICPYWLNPHGATEIPMRYYSPLIKTTWCDRTRVILCLLWDYNCKDLTTSFSRGRCLCIIEEIISNNLTKSI